MILTEKSLRKLEESSFTALTAEQRRMILERFGTEPEPYEWSLQDISEQIDRICSEHPAPKPKDPPWA
jgi:DNA-directed RNA polymerase sigma subunit (sigma70/sigma32)